LDAIAISAQKGGGQMRNKYYDDAKENAAIERCGCCDVVDFQI
jgi:hypothetical protein